MAYKSLLLIIVFIFSIQGYSQKKDKKYYNYSFDFILEYKNYLSKDSTLGNSYILSNSKDNSYILRAFPINKDSFRIVFYDYKKVSSISEISRNNFFNANTFYCNTYRYLKYNTDVFPHANFRFYKLKDSIKNRKTIKQYVFKPKDSLWAIENHRYPAYYFIEPNTEFHMPMLLMRNHYKRRKKDIELPNGIIKYFYFQDIKGKKLEEDLELVNYKKTIKEMKIKIYKKDN